MATQTGQIWDREVVYTVGSTPTTGPFDIPFLFLDNDEVQVLVGGVEETAYTVHKASHISLEGNYIELDVAVADTTVTVLSNVGETRNTAETFVQAELSKEIDRIFALFQELAQKFGRTVRLGYGKVAGVYDPADGAIPVWNEAAQSFENGPSAGEIENAADNAAAAASSASAAASSAGDASSSASAASDSEAKAQKWAEEDEDVEVEPGAFSARHWAIKAAGIVNVSIGDLTDWPEAVSPTEVSYLDGVTSGIQAQIDGKAASAHTHGIGGVIGLQAELNNKYDATSLPKSTQSQAETGTNDSTYMTPLTTAKAIASQAAGSITIEETITITGSETEIDIALNGSGNDSYEFEFLGVLPDTNNVQFFMLTSTDGGTTFASGASDYASNGYGTGQDDAAPYMDLTMTNVGNGTITDADGVFGLGRLIGAHRTNNTHLVWNTAFEGSAGAALCAVGQSWRVDTGNVNAVRLYWSSGGFDAGTIIVRRIAG